jgi:hypothetical protein
MANPTSRTLSEFFTLSNVNGGYQPIEVCHGPLFGRPNHLPVSRISGTEKASRCTAGNQRSRKLSPVHGSPALLRIRTLDARVDQTPLGCYAKIGMQLFVSMMI